MNKPERYHRGSQHREKELLKKSEFQLILERKMTQHKQSLALLKTEFSAVTQRWLLELFLFFF